MKTIIMSVVELRKLPVHPLAETFPLMSKKDTTELAQDIEENGLLENLVMWEEQLLDGRNRLSALTQTNLTEVQVNLFEGSEYNAVSYIWSVNMKRRHIDTGQRASMSEHLRPYETAEANRRMLLGVADLSQEPGDLKKNKHLGEVNEILAEKSSVSRESIRKAHKLSLNATDLLEEVTAGTKTLESATRELKARSEDRSKKIHALETGAADLLKQYQKNEISLDDAYVVLLRRQDKKKREAQARSEALYKIQTFAEASNLRLKEFNLEIAKLKEVEFIDEAIVLVLGIESHLVVTKNALDMARKQLIEERDLT